MGSRWFGLWRRAHARTVEAVLASELWHPECEDGGGGRNM
jgi:hypothetical protein